MIRKWKPGSTKKSPSRADFLQCVRKVLLPGKVELFDLSLEQRTNGRRCGEIAPGGIIDKSVADKLLKLKKDFLPNRFRRDKNERHRNDNSADRDPCFVRRGLVGHRQQIKRLLVQSPVQD